MAHKLNYKPKAERADAETTTSVINNPNFIHKMFRILMKLSYYLSATIKSCSWNFPIHNLFNFRVKITARSRNMFQVNILVVRRHRELLPFLFTTSSG